MRFALVGPDLEENLSLGYLAAALRAALEAFRKLGGEQDVGELGPTVGPPH